MFKHLLGNKKRESKLNNEAFKTSNEFKFFSKPDKKEDNLFDIANSLNESANNNIKNLKIQKIKALIERAPLVDLIGYMKSETNIIRSIAAEVFSNNSSPNIYNCIDQMLNDTNENLRESCMEALSRLIQKDSLSIIEKASKDQSAKVRLKSAICLADYAAIYGDNKSIEHLNSLITDENKEVREFVIDEIGLIGNKNSAKQLLNMIEDEKYKEEREFISESLNLILSKALT